MVATGSAVDVTARPALLAAIPDDRIVTADVRDELRAGREPFSIIMAAHATVPEGGALCVRAIFEPVPLYRVLSRHGLAHWTEMRAHDDWVVWFYPEQQAAAAEPAATNGTNEASAPGAVAADAAGDVVVLDVRGLEPPEPMVRTLEALETLPAGKTLVQVNQRVPRFLLPELESRGFRYEVREQSEELVRLFIRRAE